MRDPDAMPPQTSQQRRPVPSHSRQFAILMLMMDFLPVPLHAVQEVVLCGRGISDIIIFGASITSHASSYGGCSPWSDRPLSQAARNRVDPHRWGLVWARRRRGRTGKFKIAHGRTNYIVHLAHRWRFSLAREKCRPLPKAAYSGPSSTFSPRR